jgi:hypothetical protein
VSTIVVSLVLMAVFSTAALADVADEAASIIDAMMTTLRRGEALELEDEQVMTRMLVERFCADHGNVPVWTEPETVGHLLSAFVDDDGSMQFREDLYERDATVLKALEGPIQPHLRHDR